MQILSSHKRGLIHVSPALILRELCLGHERDRNDVVLFLAVARQRLATHWTGASPSIAVLLARKECLDEALVAVEVS
jgi:hypothetical protein